MYSPKPIKYIKDKRKKPDAICYWLQISVFIIWLAIFAFLAVINSASVRDETFFDRLFDVNIRNIPDIHLLNIAFYLLIFIFIFSVISLLFNLTRLKREDDRIYKSFIFSIIGSLIGIVLFLIK
ncbi:MAG TPA: hypothetical protein VFD00_06515 [Thermoclostridium sp.]|nr:hypothetical protein [Thermoclostridium sp.]